MAQSRTIFIAGAGIGGLTAALSLAHKGFRVVVLEKAERLEEAVQDHRYAPYVARQQSEIVRLRSDEATRIPPDLDYGMIAGLSNEMIERLSAARPSTMGAAARIWWGTGGGDWGGGEGGSRGRATRHETGACVDHA